MQDKKITFWSENFIFIIKGYIMKILNTINTFIRMITIKIWLKTPMGKRYATKYKRKRKMGLTQLLKGEQDENWYLG